MGRKEVRHLLQDQLHIKPAQVYKLAGKVADQLSISTSDALLVMAAKKNINLHKNGIDPEKIKEIRELAAIPLAQAAAAKPVPVKPSPAKSIGGPVSTYWKRPPDFLFRPAKGKEKSVPLAEDPILAPSTRTEIEAMVPVYSTLYQLENSIRQYIARVLKAKHGKDWWDKTAPKGAKDTVAGRTSDDKKHAWHQKRSNSPIDYLDLNQLPAVVRHNQTDFVDKFLPSLEWFQVFVEEVYRSRCVVCHMNPLNQNNVDAVKVRSTQWQNLVNAKLEAVNELEKGSEPVAEVRLSGSTPEPASA